MNRRLLLCLIVSGSLAAMTSANATVFEVSIVDNEYIPQNVNVAVGDSIHWTNNGLLQHTVDSGSDCIGDGDFDSPTLDPGDDFGYFVDSDDAGLIVDYFCDFHCEMGMVGSFTVEELTPTEQFSWGKIKTRYR